jgi:glycosyltransferase involved in cell wall biosynthesis
MTDTVITTVIPTFRRPALLKRAIESVLSQSFKHLIVCIYDNASGDETEAIVKAFSERDSRVFYFRNNENIGAQANIIQGLNAVTTPFYSLLSDDDFLLPDFYEQAITAFNTNPTIGFVCSKTIVIDLIDKKIQYRNQDWSAGLHEPSNEIISKMYSSHFTTTGVLLSKDLSRLIGVFEPSGSDLLYMTMAAATVPFVTLDSYGAAIILHESAYSIIGEGIVKESVPILYEHLLSTLSQVMSLPLPSEQKIHLLMHVLKTYLLLFDTKKLNFLVNNHNETGIDDIMRLPTLTSNRGFVSTLYRFLHPKLHSLFTALFKITKLLKQLVSRKRKTNWAVLPKDAYTLLETYDCDIAKLMPYFQKESD